MLHFDGNAWVEADAGSLGNMFDLNVTSSYLFSAVNVSGQDFVRRYRLGP